MAIKDIQVHADNDTACNKRVDLAANLAEKVGAHLTGVYVSKSFPMPSYDMFPVTADVIEAYDDILTNKIANAESIFYKAVGQDNATVSWKAIRGSFAYELANGARYSDLLVIGQPDSDDLESLNNGLADEVILASGRPCLVIPYTYTTVNFGESPLVAWDGSREASRAIHDALPLLQLAGKATILIIEPEKSDTNFSDLPGAMISEHLARHDIEVTVEISRGSENSTGDEILAFTQSHEHDLIVMGAYGHSRWREIVLGGATHSIIKNMTVPVFMSH
ncbi:universal stress protein [Leucothrix arctica]|uniref:UspA domain-containing protein n=1 Tax=Leucothrix arctica TaxID=1481894 RepID=A0A317C3D9_9GAMM|nr:universal stress protein [Leucothrix arctica]PWQ93216.1 hypothetical protein DKT75_21250 [Leucothrix arctica]